MTRREWLEVTVAGTVLAIASWWGHALATAPTDTPCKFPVADPKTTPTPAGTPTPNGTASPKASPTRAPLDCAGHEITKDRPAVDCGMARINNDRFVDDLAERHKNPSPAPTCRIPANTPATIDPNTPVNIDPCPACGMARRTPRTDRFLDRKSQRG